MRYICEELRQKRAAVGRAGGYATFFKYGRERMTAWGKLGGRPRLLTLEEISCQAGSKELSERGKRSPAFFRPLTHQNRALSLINKGGEPVNQGVPVPRRETDGTVHNSRQG